MTNQPAPEPEPKKPTIEEIEALLQSDEDSEIEILPNGEVRAKGTSPKDIKPLTMRENLGGEYTDQPAPSDTPTPRTDAELVVIDCIVQRDNAIATLAERDRQLAGLEQDLKTAKSLATHNYNQWKARRDELQNERNPQMDGSLAFQLAESNQRENDLLEMRKTDIDSAIKVAGQLGLKDGDPRTLLEAAIDLHAQLAASEQQRKEMESSACELIAKIKLIHGDARYNSVWICAANHGTPYTGPKYDKELERLEKSLRSTPETPTE